MNIKRISLKILLLMSSGAISFAQFSGFKLLPGKGGGYDNFGCSVSVSGNYAVVGAKGAEKAYVFKRSGNEWIESAVLSGDSNPGGSTMDPVFGYSVCISGDYIMVGAPFQVVPPVLNNIGAAYIFKRNEETWLLQSKLVPPEPHPFGLFGWTVSISDPVAVLGETNRNIAHVYKRTEDSWLPDTILSDGWRFGESVSCSGNNMVIGTVGGSILDTDGQGSVNIFCGNGFDWIRYPLVQASDGSVVDGFGNTVSVSGNRLLAGDNKAKNSSQVMTGAAYIYEFGDSSWTETAKITAADGAFEDFFGFAVSISGDLAVVSAPQDADKGIKSGSAYLFMYNGQTWNEYQKLLAPDGAGNDNFGCSVSTDGENVIIGADGNDDLGEMSGSAYIYNTSVNNMISPLPLEHGPVCLFQNRPNPVKGVTTIEYSVDRDGLISLKVYNVMGKEVKTLVEGYQTPGKYSVEFNSDGYREGIYHYRIDLNKMFSASERMIITK